MSPTLARLATYVRSQPARFSPPRVGDDELFEELPALLKPLHQATWGCEVDFASGALLMSVDDVLDALDDPSLWEDLPGFLPIAIDGSNWLVLDGDGRLGPAGAVYACDHVALEPASCTPVNSSLDGYVEALLGTRP